MDVLYAVNAKKEPAALLPKFADADASTPLTGSTVSIANLLEYVNRYFPDSLPEDVLKHFGHSERPAGKLGESMLFQPRERSVSDRQILANALESVAQNEREKEILADYREKAKKLAFYERELAKREQKIAEHRSGQTPLEPDALKRAEKSAEQYTRLISQQDERLLRLEKLKPLRDVVTREREYIAERLRVNGVEVDRAGQHQHVGVDHLLQDLRHVVLVDTFLSRQNILLFVRMHYDFLSMIHLYKKKDTLR